MSRILYLSDLDGTLLRTDQSVSPRSREIIGSLSEKGLLFTCATARSRFTALKAMNGLRPRLPMIVYNGTFIQDCGSGQIIHGHFLSRNIACGILDWYYAHGIFPIVYSIIDGREHFSYVPERSCRALLDFVATREGDPRLRATDISGLSDGDIFYITAMGREDILTEADALFSTCPEISCLLYPETYSGNLWLEIMPAAASKASAAAHLKETLGCDRMVCFGDGINDIPMFRIADKCYATANASPELKAIATGVIGSNDEDAVALWLEQNAEF